MKVVATSRAEPEPVSSSGRQAWADHVRIAVIAGVIITHVATAYLVDIDWYYMERTASEAATVVGWAMIAVGATFGMGLLFLVAGLFTSRSLVRKGPPRFAMDRLARLGIPLAAYVFLIDLITDFAGYRGMGGIDAPLPYVLRWWREDADLGPAWFIAVLLAFSLVYAAWRARWPAVARDAEPLPGRVLIGAVAGMALGSFVIRLVWPYLSNAVFGLSLWELPQMAVLFTLGVLAGERGWLDAPLPEHLRRRCGLAALGAGVLLPLVATAAVAGDPDAYLGGLHPEALAIPVGEAVMSVAMSVWALEWFRRRWDRPGELSRELGRSSYAAYLIHPPVVVALSLALRSVPIPAEIKFLAVAVAAVVGAFALGRAVIRWPPLARIV